MDQTQKERHLGAMRHMRHQKRMGVAMEKIYDIGFLIDLNEYESILLDPSTSEEYYDLTMRHIRDIVMNNEIQYEIRDKAANIMHQNSLDAQAVACLYEPAPLSSRKRKAV